MAPSHGHDGKAIKWEKERAGLLRFAGLANSSGMDVEYGGLGGNVKNASWKHMKAVVTLDMILTLNSIDS